MDGGHRLHRVQYIRILNVFNIPDELKRGFKRDHQRFPFGIGRKHFKLALDENI
ncbi:hypothetical protein D1872_302280 [compost metagenome]